MAENDLQRTEDWYEARRGKITGSRVSRIVDGGPAQWNRFMDVLQREIEEGPGGWLEGRDADSASLAHGRRHEETAVSNYELVHDVDVERVGFIDHPSIPMFGVSLDGLLPDRTLEVKCPFNETNHLRAIVHGMPSEHQPQVQAGMEVVGRDLCAFISYCPTHADPQNRFFMIPVERDQLYVDEMIDKLWRFIEVFRRGERMPVGFRSGATPSFF